jgi:hypothetical protein
MVCLPSGAEAIPVLADSDAGLMARFTFVPFSSDHRRHGSRGGAVPRFARLDSRRRLSPHCISSDGQHGDRVFRADI